MKQSIYLHQEIVAVLRCFGELSEVVNKILEAGAEGHFELMDKPSCPNRDGAGRYEIDVNEPNYLELLEIYGPFCSKISLRRILYWFVENEIYNELGWEQTNQYIDRKFKLLKNKLSNALSELNRAMTYANNTVKEQLFDISTALNLILKDIQK